MPVITLFIISVAQMGWSSRCRAAEYIASGPNANLDFPIVDLPFNQKGAFPSMEQSLAVSRTLYDLSHLGLQRGLELNPRTGGWLGFSTRFSFALMDFWILQVLPGGGSWLHEEWHRAVMSNRGISSFNDVYNFKIGATVIAVSHETDEELARLKKEHPEDQVRLAAAGMEAEHALATAMQKDLFFTHNSLYQTMALISLNLGPIFYLSTCSSKDADRITAEQQKAEAGSVEKRDFVGLDCNGWIRDLNRPAEPYEARGKHPSGVGVNRYTTYSELDSDEKQFLEMNKNLSFLNLLNPFLLDIRDFSLSSAGASSERVTGFLRHDLASFGSSLSANLLYASEGLKLATAIYGYLNKDHWFPGLDLNFRELPIFGLREVQADLRAHGWQQPKNFDFREGAGRVGGLIGTRLSYIGLPTVKPYINLTGKTVGWVAGQVEQGRNFQIVLGTEAML
jgi:hypothetical protein